MQTAYISLHLRIHVYNWISGEINNFSRCWIDEQVYLIFSMSEVEWNFQPHPSPHRLTGSGWRGMGRRNCYPASTLPMTSSSSSTTRGFGAEQWGRKTHSLRSAPPCTPSAQSVSLGPCQTRRTLPGPTTALSGVGWTQTRSVRCGELVWQFVLQQQPLEVKNVSCIHSRRCWWGGWLVCWQAELCLSSPCLISPHLTAMFWRRGERVKESER